MATRINVQGTLEVIGTADRYANLMSNDTPLWGGVHVLPGGTLDLSYAVLEDATTLVKCDAGAALCKLDHVYLMNSSDAALVVAGPARIRTVAWSVTRAASFASARARPTR